MVVDAELVRKLISEQFPEWGHLAIRPVARSGWDNHTFHLGDTMLVRMPSSLDYALQVEKEQKWLPKLAPHLPLPIPLPLAQGVPTDDFPLPWSIYSWLEGTSLAAAAIPDLNQLAIDLANFLSSLQKIDPTDGPEPGLHSFYRGGELAVYDDETREALQLVSGKIDVAKATAVWEKALDTRWEKAPVWVHGDISVGNLLVQDGRLSGVIDFGQLSVGDPSCDLAIAWTLFRGQSRSHFREHLPLDEATWARGRAWTLWKALIIASGLCESNSEEGKQAWQILNEVLG